MKLLPIDINKNLNQEFYRDSTCIEFLEVYSEFYKKVGFNPPWIGYFVQSNNKEFVACCGYKGKPRDGKIEIAYGTFKKFEGQGIGTEVCSQLVLLSLLTDSNIRIIARTLPENNPSTRILKKNGFEFIGEVVDEEDGKVWEWEFLKNK